MDPVWKIAPCEEDEALALAAELGLHRTTAEVLIRRGMADAASARAFLEDDGPSHDPMLLGDMAEACERIERAIAAGERICVHGDYDVDGVCATALAVELLAGLGAKVEWHLPSRFEEGYGVAAASVEGLAADGVDLLITVDCGISAVAEVRLARERGMDVIVTDHHRPGDELPDCPRVCTRPSAYPFPELCGSGVVLKLAEALHARAGRDPAELDRLLDLAALATVADVVPLADENRRIVRAGLRRMARTTRPGLRALMRVSRVDRTRVAAGDLGFRLGPRINAAGRLGHPGHALELLQTDDEQRADALADRLEALNRRRQGVEREILEEAVAQIEAAPLEWRDRRAYVLASSAWHEGVIGIVASRLVERYGRPVVLIAIGDDEAKGSGRSIPAYDLHAGLSACDGLMRKFGGHRAAAGLTMDMLLIDELGAALAEHAASVLDDHDLRPRMRLDAVLAPSEVSLELVDELARMEPFGLGNPGVTLVAPAARLVDVETMSEGRHLRAGVELGGFRCRAVGFSMGASAEALRAPGRFDVAYRLARNEWNGAVASQMLLKAAVPVPDLDGDPEPPSGAGGSRPGVADARGRGVQIATITRLAAGGADVAVIVADRGRRRRILRGPLAPGRFGGGTIALAEYGELDELEDVGVAVALDPPVDAGQTAALETLAERMCVHLVWGATEIEFARSVAEHRAPLRPALVEVWRAGRAGGRPDLPAETLAGCLDVLRELGLDPAGDAPGKVDLELSATYRAAVERLAVVERHLVAQLPATG